MLPHWTRDWLSPGLVTGLVVFSAVAFVATLLGVPWFFRRISPDHYTRQDRKSLPFLPEGSWIRPLGKAGKNVIGVCLVVMGVGMLVLPGQGLLTLIIGILLIDFPGRRRVERWLISRPPVYRAINRLRERAGVPPLELPEP